MAAKKPHVPTRAGIAEARAKCPKSLCGQCNAQNCTCPMPTPKGGK